MRPHVDADRRSATTLETSWTPGSVNQYLTELKRRIAHTHLFNVLLLILTGCSVAIFAVLYARYINTPVYVSKLKEIIRNLEVENGELSRELNRCQSKITSDTEMLPEPCQCENKSMQGKCDQNSLRYHQRQHQNDGKTVWSGDDEIMTNLAPKNQFKYEHMCDEVIHDDLFVDYIRDYCAQVRQKQKNVEQPIPSSDCPHAHSKDSQRTTPSLESNPIPAPDTPTTKFEFTDPNPVYDGYEYVQHTSSGESGSQYAGNNGNDISRGIEHILLQIDAHTDQRTKSCYIKYKQMKSDNIFDSVMMEKSQKKLSKYMKKMRKNEKRDRNEVCGENERKRDKKSKDMGKTIEKSGRKTNKTTSTKEYRKTALKTYDEHRF